MKINYDTLIERIECCVCGCHFWIGEHHRSSLQETKKTFYCPRGHAQSYKKSEADILREQLTEKVKECFDLIDEVRKLQRKAPKKKRL